MAEETLTIRSERLLLRVVREGDRELLAAIQREPEVAQWWGPVNDDDFLPIEVDPDGDDEFLQLAIVIQDEVAGVIQFGQELDPMYRSANIDMFLAPRFHRQGYGREAILLVAHYLIDVRAHHRLSIDPSAANSTAIAVYASVGFRPVGILRSYERDTDGDGWHDGLLMDLVAAELTD